MITYNKPKETLAFKPFVIKEALVPKDPSKDELKNLKANAEQLVSSWEAYNAKFTKTRAQQVKATVKLLKTYDYVTVALVVAISAIAHKANHLDKYEFCPHSSNLVMLARGTAFDRTLKFLNKTFLAKHNKKEWVK